METYEVYEKTSWVLRGPGSPAPRVPAPAASIQASSCGSERGVAVKVNFVQCQPWRKMDQHFNYFQFNCLIQHTRSLAQNFQLDLTWKIMCCTAVPPLNPGQGFVVKHYAGLVEYNTKGWLDKKLVEHKVCHNVGWRSQVLLLLRAFTNSICREAFFKIKSILMGLSETKGSGTRNMRRQHGPLPLMLWDMDGLGTTIGCCQTARNWLASWWKLGEAYILAFHFLNLPHIHNMTSVRRMESQNRKQLPQQWLCTSIEWWMMTVLPYNPLHPCTIPHSLGEQIGCWYTSVNRKLLTSLGDGQFDRNRIKQIEFTISSFSSILILLHWLGFWSLKEASGPYQSDPTR